MSRRGEKVWGGLTKKEVLELYSKQLDIAKSYLESLGAPALKLDVPKVTDIKSFRQAKEIANELQKLATIKVSDGNIVDIQQPTKYAYIQEELVKRYKNNIFTKTYNKISLKEAKEILKQKRLTNIQRKKVGLEELPKGFRFTRKYRDILEDIFKRGTPEGIEQELFGKTKAMYHSILSAQQEIIDKGLYTEDVAALLGIIAKEIEDNSVKANNIITKALAESTSRDLVNVFSSDQRLIGETDFLNNLLKGFGINVDILDLLGVDEAIF